MHKLYFFNLHFLTNLTSVEKRQIYVHNRWGRGKGGGKNQSGYTVPKWAKKILKGLFSEKKGGDFKVVSIDKSRLRLPIPGYKS